VCLFGNDFIALQMNESLVTFHDNNFCKFHVLYACKGDACALKTRRQFVTERGKQKLKFKPRPHCLGNNGCDNINSNGHRLCNLCEENKIWLFEEVYTVQHEVIRKMTWISPDGKTHTQLNHIIIKRQVEELTFRQEDRKISRCLILSDRQLLIATLTIKLHKTTGKFWRPRQHLSWTSETAFKLSRTNQWNTTSARSTIGQ